MKQLPRTTYNQKGYVLSLEFAALAIVAVLSAITIMSVAADKLPEVIHQWFEATVDNTEAAALGYVSNICQAYVDTAETYGAGDGASTAVTDVNKSQLNGLCTGGNPAHSPALWSKFNS